MKLLSVDTATISCGVAVADGPVIIARTTIVSTVTHSRHLLQVIDDTLKNAGLTVKDLDGFAVTRGPGSFTGLRISIGTIKGLAAALGKPVAGISTLEALAWPFARSPLMVCPLIDARKGEVYTCRYRFDNGAITVLAPEAVLAPEKAVADISEPCIFTGTGVEVCGPAIAAAVRENARFAPPFQNAIDPGVVAWLGAQRLAQDQAEDLDAFAPVYLRKPDAVIHQQKPVGS
ncbi:MAG: tRNA (adenosine(37)-N6)-threonylcarbamoyltransferase complex dimerization subunit type 1 TsaB [Thermodesulfobacteriota bacterium]